MAKRRRLDPAPLDPATAASPAGAPETKGMFPTYPDGVWRPGSVAAPSGGRAPVAAIAADGAQAAALDELAEALEAARSEGRLILRLPLAAVDETYLLRDRLPGALDPDTPEMAVLIASLAARGQQTAIEVADLGSGRYGLISGWRRLSALRHLAGDGGTDSVLAIARPPGEARDAYVAMVEENEIRAGLSYYERARIVTQAADGGVFDDDRAALSALFAAASRPRRSKIGSFVRIVRALDGALRFPVHLNERQGLALAALLDRDESLAGKLAATLAEAPPPTPAAEAQVIAALTRPARPPAPLRVAMAAPDRLVVQGADLGDPALRDRLMAAIRKEISLWKAE